jgi:hypothetical protein
MNSNLLRANESDDGYSTWRSDRNSGSNGFHSSRVRDASASAMPAIRVDLAELRLPSLNAPEGRTGSPAKSPNL